MKVNFLDIRAQHAEIREELSAAFDRTLESGWYITGTELKSFETEFARYCAVEHCVGVANGLDAIYLALQAFDIGPGDEVIVPSNTFIATWLAVSRTGATPIPVEPSSATYNIGADEISNAITERTKAIVPVHLYGQPADMDPIMSLATQYGLVVVEDAAQAQGAMYKGRPVGGARPCRCNELLSRKKPWGFRRWWSSFDE